MRRLHLALPLTAVIVAAACGSTATEVTSSTAARPTALPSAIPSSTTANITGIGSVMPAYYDGKLFTINFTELPPGGESANLTNNGSINNIYQSDACRPGGKPFVSVIDAVPGDGMNPLWQEVQVVFANPRNCQQFTSDDQVLAAASSGLVTLVPTGELYRCSVIGKP
jgi:hypothetical protein